MYIICNIYDLDTLYLKIALYFFDNIFKKNNTNIKCVDKYRSKAIENMHLQAFRIHYSKSKLPYYYL